MNKKTVLMLAATPPDHPKLNLAREHDQIKDVLERGQNENAFSVELRASAKWDDFPREILNKNPSVVHFSGHGAGAKGLLLGHDSTTSRLATTDELTELFTTEENQIECVLLNACLSIAQAVEIVKYVPYVIGMKQEIGDAAAIDFARGFYQAYFVGQSIGASFRWGCSAIRAESLDEEIRRHVGMAKSVAAALPEELKPTLLIRPDVYVACHEGIDLGVQQDLFPILKETRLEVVGDWQCRKVDKIPGGRALSVGAARNILVAMNSRWCEEVYAAGSPFRVTPDARVRAVLWEKCELPKEFEAVAKYEFFNVDERPIVVQRMIAALKPRLRTTLLETAVAGMQVARGYFQQPSVRGAGERVKTTLNETLRNLEVLDRWKTLHAKMHRVVVEISNLDLALGQLKVAVEKLTDESKENERRREIDRGWRNAMLAFEKVKAGMAALVIYGEGKNFAANDFPKGQIQGAAAALERLLGVKNLRNLPEANLQLKSLLVQNMTNVDKRLFESAERVPLKTLVANLNEILKAINDLAADAQTPSKIKAFEDGIEAIKQLQERLAGLLLKHNHLQNIANRTDVLDDQEADAFRIEMTMSIVAADCKQLIQDVKDAWVEEFGRRLSAVNEAIPPALALEEEEPWALRDAVHAMLCHLDNGFFDADETLKRLCEELEELRHGLDDMIEGLKT